MLPPAASLNKCSEREVWGGGRERKALCKGAKDLSEKEAVVESALREVSSLSVNIWGGKRSLSGSAGGG